jgi:outer membrane immunogenic protein
MLRRVLLASVGAFALSGAVLAADLTRPPPPPVYVPPAPPPLWTGFYIGLNAGGTWSSNNTVDVDTVTAFNNVAVLSALGATFAPASALGTTADLPIGSSGGFIGGGQVGYNYQFGPSFVAGIEADIQGIASSQGSSSLFRVTPRIGFPGDNVDSLLSASKRADYIGTVRGRLGWLVTPTFLVYGTGGLAYGGTSSNTSIFSAEVPNTGSTSVTGFGSESTTRVGWTAGGGVEWMFLPNWSVKAEYLYYDLGTVTYSNGRLTSFLTGTSTLTFINVSQSSVRFNGNIVRAGLNYHFNWAPAPVVAKY